MANSPNTNGATRAASTHTADSVLAPFIASTFDPTVYLNSSIPALALATPQQPILPAKHASLADVASQTQSHLAQLSAQETRLVATLTSLTDEILRSGSRLAYEVELLRGEAASLGEALSGQIKEDVALFVPRQQAESTSKDDEEADHRNGEVDHEESHVETAAIDALAPPALAKLRTLQQVRNNLQSVINTFDAALLFPIPPSLLLQSNTASTFVSVAAPADPAQEAAGQEALGKLRASIMDHLDPGKGADGGADGAAAAEKRLDELRDLCTVWKGTSEEKARLKVIEGWEKELHETKEKLGVGARQSRARGHSVRRAESAGGGTRDGSKEPSRDKGRGLFGGLRRLRDEMYLD